MFAPPLDHLRAGAVWVTIANWGDALASKYGSAAVVTSSETLALDDVRKRAWTDPATSSAPRAPSPPAGGAHLRTLAKDLRWARWSAHDAYRAHRMSLDPYANTPYVWQHHDLFARNGFAAARRLGVPTVLFVDAPQVWEASRWGVHRPGWGRALERIAERPQFLAASVVACVTEEVANTVSEITDGRARVLVTPCTSELPVTDKRAQTRSHWDLDGRLVVGWVGSFRRFHHVDMLIRSVARLADEAQNVTLFFIGDGPTRSDNQKLANELGLDCRFTGSVANTDVLGLLQGCDIGVLPSVSSEEFHYSPLKLKEYMAAGVPSIVPRLGEMSRTMTENSNVLFYDPGSEKDLALQVRRLAMKAELRKSIAAAGRELLRKDFSMANQLVQIERSLKLS